MTATKPTPRPRRERPHLLIAAKLGLNGEPLTANARDDRATHARATVDAQLRALLAWQRDARSGDDPEGVHSMRVALRRLRVAFRAGAAELSPDGADLEAELKWLGGALGPVRDLDVLTERLEAQGRTLPADDQPGFDEFIAVLHATRQVAQAELATILDGPRYRRLLRSLAQLVTAPTTAATPASAGRSPAADDAGGSAHLLRRALRKLRRDVAAATDESGEADLHRLRIQGKRVRYAAEQAAGAAGKRQRAVLTELVAATKELQEILGAHHDTVTAELWLRDITDDPSAPLSPRALLVVGRLVERECAHRAAQEARWPLVWHEVDRCASALV